MSERSWTKTILIGFSVLVLLAIVIFVPWGIVSKGKFWNADSYDTESKSPYITQSPTYAPYPTSAPTSAPTMAPTFAPVVDVTLAPTMAPTLGPDINYGCKNGFCLIYSNTETPCTRPDGFTGDIVDEKDLFRDTNAYDIIYNNNSPSYFNQLMYNNTDPREYNNPDVGLIYLTADILNTPVLDNLINEIRNTSEITGINTFMQQEIVQGQMSMVSIGLIKNFEGLPSYQSESLAQCTPELCFKVDLWTTNTNVHKIETPIECPPYFNYITQDTGKCDPLTAIETQHNTSDQNNVQNTCNENQDCVAYGKVDNIWTTFTLCDYLDDGLDSGLNIKGDQINDSTYPPSSQPI